MVRWKIQLKDKNITRWVKDRKSYPIELVNARYDRLKPMKGWDVFYSRSNRRRFKSKPKAMAFVKQLIKK